MGLIAIIGGTGVCDPKILSNVHEDYMDTFYGTIHYWQGTYKDKELVFLPRHGRNHSIPPHLINYRANILGLKRLGVTAILSTTAVGSLNCDDKPGDFVLPDQFLDFTKCRHTSFFDGGENGVVHVKVGSVEHPMLPEHYIEWISLHTKQGNQRKELHPGEKPEVCFALCEGDEVEAVYAYCNLHSL